MKRPPVTRFVNEMHCYIGGQKDFTIRIDPEMNRCQVIRYNSDGSIMKVSSATFASGCDQIMAAMQKKWGTKL
jgi:hypothetical protein